MEHDAIKEEIRRFITTNYLKGLGSSKLGDNDSFLEQAIIDSIGVIELAAFIQKKYKIKIEVAEIMPENFDTVNNLTRYINKKIKKK